MRLSSCFLAVALAIVSLVAASPARSQSGSQSGDIRLSYDPWQPVLPAEIQIQSGVQSGEWSLAVFGTTERVGDSALPVLVMQLLKDTALSGPQQRLTSDSARPWEYVHVVAVGERFLVFWKDRRAEGSGVWMRTVDTSGKLGPERKFSEWQFPGQGAMVLDAGGKVRLLWNDTSATGGILTQGIDSLGYPAKEWDFLDSGRASGMMGPFSNGVTAVLRVNDVPLLFDSTGAKIGVGSWSTKFGGKWHVSGDGVVTTVEGDTALLLYRNVLDTVAERVIRFVLPRPSGEKISPNSVFPYRDDDSLFVMYCKEGGVELGDDRNAAICLMQASLQLNGQVGYPKYLQSGCDYRSAGWGAKGYNSVSAGNTYHIFWDGFHRICLTSCSVTEYRSYQSPIRYTDSMVFAIQNTQRLIGFQGDMVWYKKQYLNMPTNKTITIRVLNKNNLLSNIQIDVGKQILLTTKAALARKSIIEESPALAVANNKILAGWLNRGIDTSAEFIQWRANPDTTIGSQSLLTSEMIIGRAMMQGTSRFIAASTHQWSVSTPQGDSIQRRCDFYFPTDTGWKILKGIDSSNGTKGDQLISWNQNPENEEFIVQLGTTSANKYSETVVAIDKNGNQSWRISNPPTSGTRPQIIPVSDRLLFLLDYTDLILETDDSVLRFQKLPSDRYYYAKRILGPYFLRWSESGRHFEVYKIAQTGTVGVQYWLTFEYGSFEYNNLSVIQNPSDSGFVLIYTTPKNGVWMKTLTRSLRQVTPLTRIGGDSAFTATPRAIFKNDSLFVVWIDHRNGVADVYGTVVVPQTALAVHDAPVADGGGFRIIPNPVSRRARVELARAISRERELVLHDLSGRQLRQFMVPAGASEEVIDLSGVSAGTYLLHVRGEARGELVVVRE